jgi:hypothetical protein
MRKSRIRRALWMTALVLLFTAGMASAQEQDQPSQDQPSSSDVPASSSAETAYPDTVASPSTDDTSNAINADLYSASSPYSGLPPLGAPAPLQAPSSSWHLGPFYLTNVTDSAYYSTVHSQNGNSTSFWGDNISAGIVLTHPVGQNGQLAFHASPQVLFAGGRTWFNEVNGLSFTDQLTNRWTLSASTQLAYFQNSILTNPQYALVNTSGGYVLQTLYLQTTQPTLYQYANFSASYQLGTNTTLGITPIVGFSFTNVTGSFVAAYSLGGAVSVSHRYSEKGSVSVFYGLTHSTTSNPGGVSGPTSWNSSSLGVGLSQGLGGETWSLAFNVAANAQQNSSANWTAVGNVALIKKLPQGSISANYTRSEATLLLASSGYFDQGSISYNRNFGEKLGANIGVGAYRSNQTVSNARGVRLSGSVFYQWLPSLNMSAGFFVGQQSGANGSQLLLFNGRSNNFNVGLTWTPGRTSNSVTPPSPWGSTVPGF